MTLILSVITPEYVLQVGDRRLTDISSGRIVDEEAIKAVLFNNHISFSYTGLARLPRSASVIAARGGDPTDRAASFWLAEVLALGRTLDEALVSSRRDRGERDVPLAQSQIPRDISDALVRWRWVDKRRSRCARCPGVL
jgi:hypothetical protein